MTCGWLLWPRIIPECNTTLMISVSKIWGWSLKSSFFSKQLTIVSYLDRRQSVSSFLGGRPVRRLTRELWASRKPWQYISQSRGCWCDIVHTRILKSAQTITSRRSRPCCAIDSLPWPCCERAWWTDRPVGSRPNGRGDGRPTYWCGLHRS